MFIIEFDGSVTFNSVSRPVSIMVRSADCLSSLAKPKPAWPLAKGAIISNPVKPVPSAKLAFMEFISVDTPGFIVRPFMPVRLLFSWSSTAFFKVPLKPPCINSPAVALDNIGKGTRSSEAWPLPKKARTAGLYEVKLGLKSRVETAPHCLKPSPREPYIQSESKPMLKTKFPPLKSFMVSWVSEKSRGEIINNESKRKAEKNNFLVFMLPPVNIFSLLYIENYTV